MKTRRDFLLAIACCASSSYVLPALGNDADVDYEDIDTPFPPDFRLYGTEPALGPEEDKARAILAAAPQGVSLLETAQYFERLSDQNDRGWRYNAQWPKAERWNPVIIGFYQSTSLAKRKDYVYTHGDTIDWCAAFVNWCLGQAGYQRTNSAMSGSFRLGGGLGKPATSPTAGDIIVFKKADPEKAAVGFGHVGIFLEEVPGGFRVLGGNQTAGKRHSSVCTTVIPEKNDKLVFDSIRSVATIEKAT